MKLSSRIAARHITAAAKNLTLSSKSSSFKQHKSIAIMTSLVSNTSCQEQRHMVQHRHHSQYQIMNQSLPASPPPAPAPAAAPSIIITPPPSPQLLLEGDEMYISSDGKSHTYYRLHHPAASAGSNQNSMNEYVLEEAYDIEHARKEITLLLQHSGDYDGMSTSSTPPTPTPKRQLQQQQPIKQITFPLQEITNGIQRGAGTGSTTWDSSIVMGLYFGMHPDQLVGDVLELGSGVGLGGILTGVVLSNNADSGAVGGGTVGGGGGTVTSLTLSEINKDVIHMLRYNTAVAADAIVAANTSNNDTTSVGLLGCDTKLHIDTLDWFDFVSGGMGVPYDDQSTATTATAATNDTTTARRKKYDTIIASDCIYRPSQVQPLSNTIATLLKRQRPGDSPPTNDDPQQAAVAHIFSPYNRGFIPDLIQELRDGKGLIVTADTIEMDIVRVKKRFHDDDNSENALEEDVPLINWLLGNGNDDDAKKKKSKRYNDVMMSSSRTSKFLHITASFKEDDRVKDENPLDESMTSID
mmetsp:Transcript_4735/g.7314  ORF Transcript_4735/g.7314 Transcript_4735/m.7314 type:complete len:525 (+) Transcript_4735:105-1679(+)